MVIIIIINVSNQHSYGLIARGSSCFPCITCSAMEKAVQQVVWKDQYKESSKGHHLADGYASNSRQ
jgi:hypothetical protein